MVRSVAWTHSLAVPQVGPLVYAAAHERKLRSDLPDPTRALAMSTLETTVTIEATMPPDGTGPSRRTANTEPSPGEIDGESLPNVAKRLDNFVILSKLGSGAMGVVYAAFDDNLGRRVAIKLLRPSLSRQTPRFQREAQALARLQHPNVVSVHHFGRHEDRLFLVMEFVAGKTLREWLKLGPHSREKVLSVFKDAGRGLAAAHEANLVHRDFKPDNVMVGDDGRVRVMDFGLVHEDGGGLEELLSSDGGSREDREVAQRRLDSALNLELTQPGALLGTPAYMAPEQHLGRPTDARADQFAFCVALWEALYGRRPFKGESWQELIDNVTNRNLVEPRRGADVPNWLRAVIERGLTTEPCERWDSMDELLEALDQDPTRRRRGLIAGAVSLTLVMSSIVGYRSYLDNEREEAAAAAAAAEQALHARCAAEGQGIEQVWNPELRALVSKAMLGVDHPIAKDAWQRTAAAFDDYSAKWASARAQVCVEEAEDPERATLARACLDARAQAIGSLARVFTKFKDDADILDAITSAASLPAVGDCIDDQLLDRNVSLPAPEIVSEVEAVRQLIADAAANAAMGRFDTAKGEADAAVTEAERIGWSPLTAAALYQRGKSDISLDNYAAGERDLEAALFLAGEHDSPVAINAAGALVFAAGWQRRTEDALRWGKVGQLIVTNNDAEGTLFHAKFLADLGSVHGWEAQRTHTAESSAEAIACFKNALQIYERRLPPEHPLQAFALNNLGVAHQEIERYADALVYHSRALELRKRNLPPSHPDIGYSHLGIGRVYFQQGKFELAVASLERALSNWETSYGEDALKIAYPMIDLGLSLEANGQFRAAQGHLERALKLREAATKGANPSELAMTRFALARVLWAQGKLARAELLARAAGLTYQSSGDAERTAFAEVQAWLERHGLEALVTDPSAD